MEANLWEKGSVPPKFGGDFKPNYVISCTLLERAADECNCSEAYNKLGITHQTGLQIDIDGLKLNIDYTRAFNLFTQSAKLDDN